MSKKVLKRRKKIEKCFYAERKYLTYNKNKKRIRTIYYYLKWRFWEMVK